MDKAAPPPRPARAPKAGRPRAFGRKLKPIENLTGLLDRICALVECETVPAEQVAKVKVRAIVDTIGRRAYGPLLLAIGLFSISPLTAVPGLTWGAAALTLVVALQLAAGMAHPWFPRQLLEAEVPSGGVVGAVNALRPWARRIDVALKPRLEFLSRAPFVILIGLACATAALVTFPLGFIPLAPMLPGLAVVLFGLGLTAKDGLILSLGVAIVACAMVLGWRLWERMPF